MRSTNRRLIRAAAGLAAGVIAVTLAGPASASHVLIDASASNEVTVGRTTNISVTTQSTAGVRLPGTAVIISQHVSFAGVEGYAEIGRAVTDENGVASFAYQPRSAGQHTLHVDYVSTGGEVETTTMVLDATGEDQLVHAPAGVDIPGVGVGLVLAILTVVWSILLRVAFRLVSIARSAGRPETLELKPIL